MSRRSMLSVGVAAALLVALLPGSVGASSLGTWSSDPAQSVSTTSSAVYQVQVQQPINADGTSSYKASRGVIPVKFSLASGTKTTTTTGPLVFESLHDGSVPFGWVGDTFSSPITLSAITNLSAVFNFTTGDCYGGSLRFALYTTSNFGGPNIDVYPYDGNGPSAGCVSQSGTNWTGLALNNADTTNYNGVVHYDTWANTVATVGPSTLIYGAALIVDSGWNADEVVNLTSVTVNTDTFTPTPAGQTSTNPVFAPTCNLPPATIQINKTGVNDPLPPDETVAVQAADTGGAFRISSCQYMYNLDVSSLPGSGAYTVSVLIDRTPAAGNGKFGLK